MRNPKQKFIFGAGRLRCESSSSKEYEECMDGELAPREFMPIGLQDVVVDEMRRTSYTTMKHSLWLKG